MTLDAKRHKLLRILLPVLLFVGIALTIALPYQLGSHSNAPKPVGGVLDLSEWNVDEGRLSLNGEWEFYWNRLHTNSELQSIGTLRKQIVHVPGLWSSYRQDDEALPGQGYATYRLHMIVRDTEQPLSLRLNDIATAYRLFVNDKELFANGTVGTDSKSTVPGYQSSTITFQPPAKEFDLVLQVSNYSYSRGGVWYEIGIGTPEQIDLLSHLVSYKDAILLGSLIIMAMYYAAFYSVLRKIKSNGYMMLLCLIFIVRTSLYGDRIILLLFPNLPFDVYVLLTYASLYVIKVVLFLSISSLYPKSIPAFVNRAAVVYGIGAVLITALLPMQIYTLFLPVIEAIAGAMVIYLIVIVGNAYMRSERGALLNLVALFGIFFTGIHDVLYYSSIIYHSFGELLPVGIFFLLVVFSFASARRLSDAYEQASSLNLHLEESLKKEKEATEELVRTELSFLKAQIKPHFLYNTLNVITALSTKDPPRTQALLYALSDYLRGSFNFENYNGLTPIESELDTVRAYVSIELERFRDKLHVEYDIDESIAISVPLLTIQPLVENAIRHGIMKRAGSGTVRISVQRGEDCTIIIVNDDGVGISAEKLTAILGEPESRSGVGLKNVQRRLMLHYGQRMEIHSAVGAGTTITMRIPD